MKLPTHEDLFVEIPAYVAGSLDGPMRRRLELHLATCEHCQQLVEPCEGIAAKHRGAELVDDQDHPAPLRLRELALDGEASVGSDIVRHIRHCPACSLVVTAWQREGATGSAPQTAAFANSPMRWLAPLAASLLFGIMLGAAGTSLLWNPEASRQTPWTGAVNWLLLEGATRSGPADAPSIDVVPGQPYLFLAVQLEPLADPTAIETFRFSILEADGTVSWETRLSGTERRTRAMRDGFVLFLIPAGTHPPGVYELQIFESDSASPSSRMPFSVGALDRAQR